jgi:hypothetical protein
MKDHSRRSALFMGAAASLATVGGIKAVAAALPDPIYAVIEQHRKAARKHIEAVRIQFAYEEHGGKQGERLQEYRRLEALTDTAYYAMDEAGCSLVNTRPTTLAGILALCRYIEPLFGETDQPDLPDNIEYEDAASAYIPEAFAYVIGRAIEELMKTTT